MRLLFGISLLFINFSAAAVQWEIIGACSYSPIYSGHHELEGETNIGKLTIEIFNKNNIKFADYGTTFAKEWYQIFFYDPEGNIVEVHQFINKN